MYSFSLCCLKPWQRCARQSLWCFEFIVKICLLKGLKIQKLISLPEFKACVGAVRDESMGVVISPNKLLVFCFFGGMLGLCLSVFLSVYLSPEPSPLCIIYQKYRQYASTLLVRSPLRILDLRWEGITWLNIDFTKKKKSEFPLPVFNMKLTDSPGCGDVKLWRINLFPVSWDFTSNHITVCSGWYKTTCPPGAYALTHANTHTI